MIDVGLLDILHLGLLDIFMNTPLIGFFHIEVVFIAMVISLSFHLGYPMNNWVN